MFIWEVTVQHVGDPSRIFLLSPLSFFLIHLQGTLHCYVSPQVTPLIRYPSHFSASLKFQLFFCNDNISTRHLRSLFFLYFIVLLSKIYQPQLYLWHWKANYAFIITQICLISRSDQTQDNINFLLLNEI